MKNYKLLSLVLVAALSVVSEAFPADSIYPNIHTGDFQISGATSLGYTHTSFNGGGSNDDFSLQTTTVYFIHTALGIGGTFAYDNNNASNSYRLGPTILWHVFHKEQFSIPISGSMLIKHTSAGTQSQTNPDVLVNAGFLFYPIHSMGFGPLVQFEQLIGSSYPGYPTSEFSVLASLSVFL